MKVIKWIAEYMIKSVVYLYFIIFIILPIVALVYYPTEWFVSKVNEVYITPFYKHITE